MATPTNGVGMFTAENIAAVLSAISHSNGTYEDVAAHARSKGSALSPSTIAKWVSRGRNDAREQKRTAMERFAKAYQEKLTEHCSPESNRNRQMDRALVILERICECGQPKELDANGQVTDQCRRCTDLDRTSDRKRRSNAHPSDSTTPRPTA